MTAMVATARCLRCDWTTGPATMADADRAAEKHTKSTRHATVTMAEPAP